MNIVLFAWCPTSVLYLEALAAAGAAPRLVVTGARSATGTPLSAACSRLGVPLERRDDVHAGDLVARIGAADLLLVAGCALRPRPGALRPRTAPRRALNFHPSRFSCPRIAAGSRSSGPCSAASRSSPSPCTA